MAAVSATRKINTLAYHVSLDRRRPHRQIKASNGRPRPAAPWWHMHTHTHARTLTHAHTHTHTRSLARSHSHGRLPFSPSLLPVWPPPPLPPPDPHPPSSPCSHVLIAGVVWYRSPAYSPHTVRPSGSGAVPMPLNRLSASSVPSLIITAACITFGLWLASPPASASRDPLPAEPVFLFLLLF